MAYALSSIISAVLLYVLFRRGFPDCSPRRIPQFLLKSAFCAGGAALFLLLVGLPGWDSANKAVQLAILGIKALAGMAGYFLAAMLLQMKEPAAVLAKAGRMLARFR